MSAAKQKQYQQRRSTKLQRHRFRRRRAPYQPYRYLRRDQQEVAQRLVDKRVELVTVTGWGFVESFLVFLDEIRFYALLGIEGKGYQRVMIPLAQLLMTYQLKVLLGISSMNLVPGKLFGERALMKLIGYTAEQLRAGYCLRGNLSAGPMHKNTLSDAIERLTPQEVERILNGAVRKLRERGYFHKSSGCFALDATELETTRKYQGAGVRKHTEKRVTKAKQVVEVERYVWGFKLLAVYEPRLRLVVAAKVMPINEHEVRYTLELVAQALQNLGQGVLKVLLIDRGFLDGADLWTLKHELGIEFVIPAKDDMKVTAAARALSRLGEDGHSRYGGERAGKQVVQAGKAKHKGQVSAIGVAGLRCYDQYGTPEHAKGAHRKDFVGNAINAVVVSSWEGEEYKPDEEQVWLTSLEITQPLLVLDHYDERSLIENTLFRELKQGWCLGSYPKKTEAAVRGHVILTLVTFTLANAWRTKQGQALAGAGIRRYRAEQHSSQVLVLAGECYALFDIETLLTLLGVELTHRFNPDSDHARHKHHIPDAA